MESSNPTWAMNPIGIWTQAEVNVGVVCACMPSFAGLMRRAWSETIGSYISKLSNTTGVSGSRISGKDREQGKQCAEEELRCLPPPHAVQKKVDTSVVYSGTVEYTDELELASRSSAKSEYDWHKYTREW